MTQVVFSEGDGERVNVEARDGLHDFVQSHAGVE